MRKTVAAAAALALLAACRGDRAPGEIRRYAVRGEIVQLPPAGPRGVDVLVRHEALDDFVDRSGKIVGMDAMVMPFRVEPPAQARGLAVGDKVSLRFSMDWEKAVLRLDRIERLPPDTVLRFGPARPGAGPGQ